MMRADADSYKTAGFPWKREASVIRRPKDDMLRWVSAFAGRSGKPI